MKKRVRFLLPLLLILLALTGGASIKLITAINSYTKLTNYVGIVRGASQRLVKLELSGRSDQELEAYIEDILAELQSGEGKYGLSRPADPAYRANVEGLSRQWKQVRQRIEELHHGSGEEELLADSEKLFEIANDTVFSIEDYSKRQGDFLVKVVMINVAGCLIIGILTIAYFVNQYFTLKKRSEKLADLAARDSLTGVYTRENFAKEAQKALDQRQSGGLAVEYLDFENFKYVNDVFGYEYGDGLLKLYTETMVKTLRQGEFMGRSAADRFMVLRLYENKSELLEIQKKVDKEFSERVSRLSRKHVLTVACGFCCLEDIIEHLDAPAMINRANYAQKTIKTNPATHYAFYNEAIREKMIEENGIKNRMEEALGNGEFIIYLQPKVSLKTGQVHSAEALVRWKLLDGRILPPGIFIPVFEKNYMIGELDQYVFESVCRWMGERLRNGLPLIPVSVNVSKLRLYTSDFVETYVDLKNRYGIPDQKLEIEFTETVAFENLNYMKQIIEELHQNGFVCSLDDFGKGYSSLGMLKQLPIDIVKLDASFFQEGANTERERIIITNVLNLIRQLHLTVVAEGVEQKEQVELLKQSGCDLVQGYYYYRPMPVEDLEAVLDREQEA